MERTAPEQQSVGERGIFIVASLGWLLVIIAYVAFPVFAPDVWRCEGPPGFKGPYGCGYVDAPIHTLWTWEQQGGHGIPPSLVVWFFVGLLFLLAIVVRHWFITTIALVASLMWTAYLGLLLYEMIPHPLSIGYVIAAILASLGSLTIAGGNITLLKKPRKSI